MRRSGHVVGKDELLEEIWADSVWLRNRKPR
ncbi:MAG: hypothetical protein ABW208_00600 [Pyrinomonadaceae bacterium]